jgi:putative oxidoreductase
MRITQKVERRRCILSFASSFRSTGGPASLLLIRLAVGLIFFTQGILKFTDPNMGVARFTRIGFSHPYFTAHFVGSVEILCGFLMLLGCGHARPRFRS